MNHLMRMSIPLIFGVAIHHKCWKTDKMKLSASLCLLICSPMPLFYVFDAQLNNHLVEMCIVDETF